MAKWISFDEGESWSCTSEEKEIAEWGMTIKHTKYNECKHSWNIHDLPNWPPKKADCRKCGAIMEGF